ncbi:MAG TPA: ThuA domain-containing protein [Vicinamibacterales bacterium]|nr:ThuA domain-containing protein [Vicinamibacterales bacterium]
MKKFLAFAVVAAVSATLLAQNPPAAPAGKGSGGSGMPQGGRGPIKLLLITKGHGFERNPYFQMWDALGETVTWTHVEHPAADLMMTPQYAKNFDVLAFFDLGGPGGPTTTWDGKPIEGHLSSNKRLYPNPSPELKTGFRDLLRQGKGMVFLHHASAAWVHTWPEYAEVVGGACDWSANTTIRGIDMPNHLAAGSTPQHITIVNPKHPIAEGLTDGFDLIDEAYACAWFEDSVTPIARTDFRPADPARYLGTKWPYSNLSAWVKVSENSPVFYGQMGHGPSAWFNPKYRQFLTNAIKWAASPEALAWAKANPTRIFK